MSDHTPQPDSQPRPVRRTDGVRVIAVADDGTVSIDAVPVSMAELESELRTSIGSDPETAVILRGDRAVQYDQIMQVLDIPPGPVLGDLDRGEPGAAEQVGADGSLSKVNGLEAMGEKIDELVQSILW